MNGSNAETFAIPLSTALRTLVVNMTREGQQTGSVKVARLLHPYSLALQAVFVAHDGYASSQTFVASAVDGSEYLLVAIDEVLPKRANARYLVVSEDAALAVDLNDGSGSAAGSPATVGALVRVDGLPAVREVVAVERQADGQWRIAGNASLDEGTLELSVTGGAVYAMAVDDYGTLYQSGLAVTVGQTIRPTTFAGWLYRITEAGSLPASEPAWWDGNLTGPQDLGTARAEVVRYHRPLAHGPITVETT